MKNMVKIMVAGLIAFAFTYPAVAGETPQTTAPAATTTAAAGPKIDWLTYDAGIAKAKKENKPIVIDFTASWCGWCKRMDRETFVDERVVRYMKDKYVPVKVWGDNSTPGDMVFHNGEKVTQKALTQVFGVRGFPTFWFLDSAGGKIGPSPGYKKADEFLALMEFIEGSHYKTMTYDNFMKKRNGKG